MSGTNSFAKKILVPTKRHVLAIVLLVVETRLKINLDTCTATRAETFPPPPPLPRAQNLIPKPDQLHNPSHAAHASSLHQLFHPSSSFAYCHIHRSLLIPITKLSHHQTPGHCRTARTSHYQYAIRLANYAC